MKDVKIFLEHIIESIELLEEYLKGVTKEKFVKNKAKQDLAVRRLEVIGEAVKNIPKSFREKYPKVEWKEVAGTRDVLIHIYFDIDQDLVWKIVKYDVPTLKKQIKEIIKFEENKKV